MDGRLLANLSSDGTVVLRDAKTGTPSKTLLTHSGEHVVVTFSHDSKTLASADKVGTIKLWDVATGKEKYERDPNSQVVTAVAVSQDGVLLATGGLDGSVQLRNLVSGKTQPMPDGHADRVNSLAFSPDGATLASGSHDKTAKLWNVETGILKHALEPHSSHVACVRFNHDGTTLISGSGKTVAFWTVLTGESQRTMTFSRDGGLSPSVLSIAMSPDGRFFACGCYDGMVRLVDVATGEEKQTLQRTRGGIYAVAFNPAGKTLATASYGNSDNNVRVWDLLTRKELSRQTARIPRYQRSPAIGFNPTGRLTAWFVGGVRVTVSHNDADKLPVFIQFSGVAGVGLTFTPDGRHLVTTMSNGTVYVLRLRKWSADDRAARKLP